MIISFGTWIAMGGMLLITVALHEAFQMLWGYKPLDLVKFMMTRYYLVTGFFMTLSGWALNMGQHMLRGIGKG